MALRDCWVEEDGDDVYIEELISCGSELSKRQPMSDWMPRVFASTPCALLGIASRADFERSIELCLKILQRPQKEIQGDPDGLKTVLHSYA